MMLGVAPHAGRGLKQGITMNKRYALKSNSNKQKLNYLKKLGSDLLALNIEQVSNSLKKQILFDLEAKL